MRPIPSTFQLERWPSPSMMCHVFCICVSQAISKITQTRPTLGRRSKVHKGQSSVLWQTRRQMLQRQHATCNMVALTWLQWLYHTYVASETYVWATTTYLLHLLCNTIFVEKSSTHVHICYLQYHNDLDSCIEYAWGVATLACLYDQLSYMNKYGNK